MTVRLGVDGAIMLHGSCPIEDAEPLLQLLRRHPGAPVDWRECELLHTAIVQVLFATKPALRGPAGSMFLRQWIAPALSDQLVEPGSFARPRSGADEQKT